MTPQRFTDLDDELAVGSFIAHPDEMLGLKDEHGVGAVVTLQTDEDLREHGLSWNVLWTFFTRHGLKTTRVPIRDFDPSALGKRIDDGVAAVLAHVEAGRKVYVHCTAGLNRSPSVVIAYLVAHRGMSLGDAVEWVATRHECVPYAEVLVDWAQRHGLPLGGAG